MNRIISAMIIASALVNMATADEPHHWAFRKPADVNVPDPVASSQAETPIDRFLNNPVVPPTERQLLIRRVTFDLIGLPPTVPEVETFVTDASPNAYERVLDRLLASPAYGERWGRHWLDVARYADSNGLDENIAHGNAWRYRDYVIQSLNADKPYDQFLTEQLAGDLLPTDDRATWHQRLIATGFLSLGPKVLAEVDEGKMEMDIVDEQIDTVGRALMGLTLGCARCHDHKFDPISQADYFRLQAFFANTHSQDLNIATDDERDAFSAELLQVTLQLKPIKNQIDAIDNPIRSRLIQAKKAALEPIYQDALNTPADQRSPIQKQLVKDAQTLIKVTWDEILAELTPEQKHKRDALRQQKHTLEAQLPIPKQITVVTDKGEAPPTYVLIRGEVHDKGPRVGPAVPRVLRDRAPMPTPSGDRPSRLELAQWLTDPANPLPSRVIVNRIWQHNLGSGIVTTPNDFGRRGARPTHPALLDWLAGELIRDGWHLKHVQRLILTSAAYRHSTARKRLQGEALRDAALAVSGSLNRQLGGPMIRVPLEPAVYDLIFTEDEPDGLWPVTPDASQHDRRSIYLFAKRNVRLPILEAFDQPDRLNPCGERPVSTFAPQALILMNGPFMQEQAQRFAARLRHEAGTDPERVIQRAYALAFARSPHDAEIVALRTFLSERTAAHRHQRHTDGNADAFATALTELALALLNTNEFVYIR